VPSRVFQDYRLTGHPGQMVNRDTGPLSERNITKEGPRLQSGKYRRKV